MAKLVRRLVSDRPGEKCDCGHSPEEHSMDYPGYLTPVCSECYCTFYHNEHDRPQPFFEGS